MKFTLDEVERNKAIDFTDKRRKKKEKHWRKDNIRPTDGVEMEKEFFKHIDRNRKEELKK